MNSNVTPEGTPVDPSVVTGPVDPAAIAVPAKKSKVRRNVLLAGSAVGLVGIGSTLAANISLNGGNNVEFGQGVARTTACDEDGFTINPVTSYDSIRSIFRLDRVEVTGVNLTPVGTGWNSGALNGAYADQAAAKTAHPGEYFDPTANSGAGDWKRTCDGVVLDFKAYTDDINFWSSTRDGAYGSNHTITSPVGWVQWNGNPSLQDDNAGNFGFAAIIDTADSGIDFDSNYGVGDTDTWGNAYYSWLVDINTSSDIANSSFSFGSTNDLQYRPNAASISKIAVASMATFPQSYYLHDGGGIGRG
jgi:hypothetical protein